MLAGTITSSPSLRSFFQLFILSSVKHSIYLIGIFVGGLFGPSGTFENTKNLLPTEFNNVTVTRRFYKNGESEYRLNDVACRLKDIHNLFSTIRWSSFLVLVPLSFF